MCTQRTRELLLSIAFFVLAAVVLISCTSNHQKSNSSTPTANAAVPTTQPTSHWVQDQRLRAVMAELSKNNPNWPAGLPQDPESAQKPKDEAFDEVAELANSLMLSAQQLPKVTESIKMNEADREGFLAQARVLRDQARRLRDSARQHRIEQMQENMVWLNSTCLACHSRYRDFSGQLDSTRVSASP